MAKRQTIWLSTMMVLSLMLIGFYTVNNGVEQVSTDPSKAASGQKAADANKGDKVADKAAMKQSDYFVSYRLKSEEEISQRVEQLQQVIADAKASADQVDKAKKDLETLNNTEDQVGKVIDLIVAEGYPDAIVNLKDGKVNVTVQSQELDKKKAVKIMGIVSKEMSVPSVTVTVTNHD
jgi:stage III sporulation protein AH